MFSSTFPLLSHISLQNVRVDIVAVINDTVATQMAGAFKNHDCVVGLILGKFDNHCINPFQLHVGLTSVIVLHVLLSLSCFKYYQIFSLKYLFCCNIIYMTVLSYFCFNILLLYISTSASGNTYHSVSTSAFTHDLLNLLSILIHWLLLLISLKFASSTLTCKVLLLLLLLHLPQIIYFYYISN